MRYLATLLILVSVPAHAEIRELYRAARATAMGGASVAVVDDFESLWLNPAGLAANMDKEIHYATLDIEASQDIYYTWRDNQNIFSSLDISNLNQLMGYNSYARAQFSPSVIMPNFGFALLTDGQAAFYAKNQAFPQFTLGYQNTNGVQFAFGFEANRRRGSRRFRRMGLSLGAAVKVLWRRGGFYRLPRITLLNLTEGRSELSSIVGNYEMGVGLDLGSQFEIPVSRRSSLSLGASFLNVGDVSFANQAQNIEGNFSVGAGYKYRSGIVGMTAAYDYRNIFQDVDWRQRNHFGVEFSLERVSVQLGLNQVYFTGGLALDIWYLRASILTYGQELGNHVFQDQNRRVMLRLDFKLEL